MVGFQPSAVSPQVFRDLNILPETNTSPLQNFGLLAPPKREVDHLPTFRGKLASRLSNRVKFLYFCRTQAGKFLGYGIFPGSTFN